MATTTTTTSGANTVVDEKTSRISGESTTKASLAGTGGAEAEKADMKEVRPYVVARGVELIYLLSEVWFKPRRCLYSRP